jgi:hypothetical protein
VSEKSLGKRVSVPVDSILKGHTWLPDVGLATGVRNCGRERAGGCILPGFRMPKSKFGPIGGLLRGEAEARAAPRLVQRC